MQTQDSIVFDQIKRNLSIHLPDYSIDKINIVHLSGLTNQTFRIDSEGKPSVIYRKFGDNFDRDVQNLIFRSLEEINIAPKCYYACSKFRIEEFIPNASHPTTEELKDDNLKKQILKELFKYHSNDIQIVKNKPLFIEEMFSQDYISKIKSHKDKSQNQNFKQLYKDVEAQYDKKDEIKELVMEQDPQKSKQKIRFCHNDLNNLNLFVKPEVTLIDYEYSGYNYYYYDVANFLNECQIDYQVKEYPYFKCIKKLSLDEISKLSKLYPEWYEGFDRDIIKGLVACNLYWAGWSIIMAYDSTQGKFGTVQHGLKRMEIYHYYKQLLN